MSESLAKAQEDTTCSYIYNNDVIGHLSLGSLEAVKNATVEILSQSDNNLQRMYQVVNAGNTFGTDASQKINKILKVKSGIDYSKLDQSTVAEKLVPPGKVFHIYKKTGASKHHVMENSRREIFTEIVIAPDMYLNHMPTVYEAGFKSVLENQKLE